jgi:hypothetical protein
MLGLIDFYIHGMDTKVPKHDKKTLSNTSSDHCPFMCTSTTKFICANIFRIENTCLNQQDFIQMVNERWQQIPRATTPKELHYKLKEIRKAIINWKRQNKNTWKL